MCICMYECMYECMYTTVPHIQPGKKDMDSCCDGRAYCNDVAPSHDIQGRQASGLKSFKLPGLWRF